MQHMGQGIQEWTMQICGRKSLKNSLKFFKGCFSQILLGPFLNTLTNIQHDVVFTLFQLMSAEKEKVVVNFN